MIERILVYANTWAASVGYYKRFKVETRLNTGESWRVCKDEYSMKEPYNPHEVQCDEKTIAKYVRLSVRGWKNLYLQEVQVIGTPLVEQ